MRWVVPFLAVVIMLSAALNSRAQAAAAPPDPAQARDAEIKVLRAELNRISTRLAVLGAKGHTIAAIPASARPSPATAVGDLSAATTPEQPSTPDVAAAAATATGTAPARSPVLTPADAPTLALFRSTTINFDVDGYYGYNFNHPIGQVNRLLPLQRLNAGSKGRHRHPRSPLRPGFLARAEYRRDF